MGAYGSINQPAAATPFDNTTNGFTSTNVQSAIEEVTRYLVDGEVTATANANINTGADALLTSMTMTPAAGTYITWFSCDINSGTAGAAISISFYVGGVQNAASLRKIIPFSGGTLTSGSGRGSVAIQAVLTVNGSQAIEVRASTSSGTQTAAARALTTLRVG